jgi:hypothetical protein
VFHEEDSMTSSSNDSRTDAGNDTPSEHHHLLDRARNLVWLGVALAGLVMIIGGAYALVEGLGARNQVTDKLEAQGIVTPEDASIPNETVDDEATAESMAEIIGHHAEESTGGLTTPRWVDS